MKSCVVLIPGAGGAGWIWRFVEADLRGRGFDAFAVDEPAGPRTRRFALVAGLICATVLALTLVLILRTSQSGE